LGPNKFWKFKAEAGTSLPGLSGPVEAMNALALDIIDVSLAVLLLFTRPVRPKHDISAHQWDVLINPAVAGQG